MDWSAVIDDLQEERRKLQEENKKLKALCRYQYITLGFYGTPYNYDKKNIVHHPISGEEASGIMFDGGEDARRAASIATDLLGFTPTEICDWGSVFDSLEQALKFRAKEADLTVLSPEQVRAVWEEANGKSYDQYLRPFLEKLFPEKKP